MAFGLALPWSPGEERIHRLLHVPEQDNPTSSFLTPYGAHLLQQAPLLAVGTLDSEDRPWATVWGGETGLSRPLGSSIIGLNTIVERKYDPVVQALFKGNDDGEVMREEGMGRIVAGLTIDLEKRKRVKLHGRMIAGAVTKSEEADGEDHGSGNLQLAVKIEQSLGNCPKYLNKKKITPTTPKPKLISDGPTLPPEAITLLHKADLFFIASSNADKDADTNIRGGPPGFVRVLSNEEHGAEIIYPEYSGNRLYQTLGNLITTPKAGLVFPDFETGDVLYLTGTTEILIGEDATNLLPRSNVAVKIKITQARFVQQGLPFRGTTGEFSPYNPSVRLLAKEGSLGAKIGNTTNTAKLLSKSVITPTINRYRFAMSNPVPLKPGQWVALDFSEELYIGYSHMREDDPKSLNDDFVRTFTVSSWPDPPESARHNEFEITVRRNGPVTAFLAQQSSRSGLEVAMRGFGGDFRIQTGDDVVGFVAGGVGITPLLGQAQSLDPSKIRVFWTLSTYDLDFVKDTFKQYPDLTASMNVFLTGTAPKISEGLEQDLQELRGSGAKIELHRFSSDVFDRVDIKRWYLCASRGLETKLLEWLEGKDVIYEHFDY